MDHPDKAKKIVIVEDDVALADIYKTRLDIIGYNCFVAADGIEALALIQKELPDLVLLDLMVPKMAGDQILERMRASEWGRNIPVYVISNLNESDAPAGLRKLGIVGYSVKANLSDDQIDQIVDQILKPADQKEDIHLDKPETEDIGVSIIPPDAPIPTDTSSSTTGSLHDDGPEPIPEDKT